MSDKPTPAQARALRDAIERGDRVRIRAGASASRMRWNLLSGGWIEDGRPTKAAYEALGIEWPGKRDGNAGPVARVGMGLL